MVCLSQVLTILDGLKIIGQNDYLTLADAEEDAKNARPDAA